MPAAHVTRLVDACCGSFSLGCVMRVFIRVHLRKQPSRTLVCHIEDGKCLFAVTCPSVSTGTARTSVINSANGGGGGCGGFGGGGGGDACARPPRPPLPPLPPASACHRSLWASASRRALRYPPSQSTRGGVPSSNCFRTPLDGGYQPTKHAQRC